MPFIHLTCFIAAPRERVFDLSRNLDLHRVSMEKYGEKLVDGPQHKLVQLDDTLTWSAKHLFKERRLKVKITGYKRPDFFIDEQVEGDFTLMKHEHYFKPVENGTLLIDQMRFETPYGVVGKLVNGLYLEKYMTRLLEERNAFIKKVAEGSRWKQYVSE